MCIRDRPTTVPITAPTMGIRAQKPTLSLIHIFITTQPTCGAAGVKTFTCTKCQATYTEQVPATGAHNFSILVSETPAQVGVDGSRVYQCSVCGAQYTEVIPALPAPPSSTPTATPTNSTPTGTETNSTAQPAA